MEVSRSGGFSVGALMPILADIIRWGIQHGPGGIPTIVGAVFTRLVFGYLIYILDNAETR